MSNRRVVVTGLGVVSPFGIGVEAFWEGLASGASAIRRMEGFDAGRYRSGLGAEVPRAVYENRSLREAMGSPVEDSAYFLALAADEALASAKAGPQFSDGEKVACILGSLSSGSRITQSIARAYSESAQRWDGPHVSHAMVHSPLHFLTARHNLTGPSTLISTACASTTDAIGHAFDLISTGACESALAGGGDVLSEFTHGGFNALFSITLSKPRPFDEERDGFAMGEGAALLYMETEDSARARGHHIHAEVLGYGLSNTGYHLTATSEDGCGEALAIARALQHAKVEPSHVDYINTHGTATRHNDASEIKAINATFGLRARNIYGASIKAAIGHCMGAAGAMEALSTVISLDRQIVPPTVNSAGSAQDLKFRLVAGRAKVADIDIAVSQSFGFGGACSCLVMRRYDNARRQP